MINSQDIKKGTCIRMDGKLYFCIDFLHRKPGKGNTIMNVTLKDVVNGYVLERRFNIGEKLEDVRVERRPYQFLYKDGDQLVFMNNETYEQVSIAPDQVNGVAFMKESQNVEVVTDTSTETVLYADVPAKVHLQVTWTEPGLKGDTATNTLKPSKVETGAAQRSSKPSSLLVSLDCDSVTCTNLHRFTSSRLLTERASTLTWKCRRLRNLSSSHSRKRQSVGYQNQRE